MLKQLSIPLLLVLIGFLLYVGRPVLLPFVLALFLWYLINALARLVAEGSRRWLVPLPERLCLGIVLLLLVALLWFLGGLIADSTQRIGEELPGYVERLERLVESLADRFGVETLPRLDLLEGLNVGALLTGLFSSLAALLGSGGIVLLYIVFLLLEQRSFPAKVQALFPTPERQRQVQQLLAAIDADIRSYLLLKGLMSLLTATGSYFLMRLVGVDFAELWALLIFLLNFIPYLGSVIGVGLPVLFGLLQSLEPTHLLLLLGLLAGLQILVGNVLEPHLFGKSLNLSPVMLLFTLAVWGGVWGGTGMFLAVPIMVIVMIVFSNIPQLRPIAVLMSQDGQLRH